MFVSKKSLGCLFLVVIAGCGGGTTENLPTANLASPTDASASNGAADNEVAPSFDVTSVPKIEAAESQEPEPPVERFPEVTIVTSLGEIRVRLNGEKAPETVDNFLYNYVDRGFYDGTIFHFVQDGFIAIAGGYDAELKAKEPQPPIRNEAGNGLKNVTGTIAMSRYAEYADSATSQFYLNLADNATLDQTDTENGDTFGYCVFGEVVEGIDVVQKIAKVKVRDTSELGKVPVDPVVIQTVRRDK